MTPPAHRTPSAGPEQPDRPTPPTHGKPFELSWALPDEPARRVRTLEAHAAGEPLRIVLDGIGPIPGETILEKRAWARSHLDALRRTIILEPRGHRDMYGALLTDPVTPDGDLGVLFLHNEGFSTMCGHGVVALSAAMRRMGALPPGRDFLLLDTPAGRVRASFPDAPGSGPVRVRFRNVPSFALALDREVAIPGYGTIRYDLGFGGAFYAFIDAEAVGIPLDPDHASRLSVAGREMKAAIQAAEVLRHPHHADLGFLYGVILIGPARGAGHHSRNVCIFGDGEVDRSPTGTGVSARAAIHHARGELADGEVVTVESLLGTTFSVRVLETTRVGTHPAVVPEVEGTGHLTGRSEFFLDPADPLLEGIFLR